MVKRGRFSFLVDWFVYGLLFHETKRGLSYAFLGILVLGLHTMGEWMGFGLVWWGKGKGKGIWQGHSGHFLQLLFVCRFFVFIHSDVFLKKFLMK